MPPQGRSVRGSQLSDKQLARTVVLGQKVTFVVAAQEPVVGYVFGVDDYHWAVVTPEGETTLVHKSTPLVHIASSSTYDDEPRREELEAMVAPFRRVVARRFRGVPENEQASTRQHTDSVRTA